MNINKMKNFVIIILVVTAVFQTGKLWLEDSISHNFFYTVFSYFKNDNVKPNEKLNIIEPGKIAIGYGNKKFDLLYTWSGNNIVESSNKIIGEVINKGTFDVKENINWKNYLENRVVIYYFPFEVSAIEYAKAFGNKVKNFTSKVSAFDHIILLPKTSERKEVSLCFINSGDNEAYKFSIDSSEDISSEIDKAYNQKNSDLTYVSTMQRDFHIFKEDVFMPQWTGERFYYNAVMAKNPYEYENAVNTQLLEPDIDRFFTNFATKRNDYDGDTKTYIFSDENNIVKYYETGVLEYYNYSAAESYGEQTLSRAYTACMEFLKTVPNIKNKYYLKNVEFKSEGLVFYFDYEINGFPVVISEALKEKTGIDSAIEVVIKNNTVKKYKQIAFSFEQYNEIQNYIDKDFVSALNDIMMQFPEEEEFKNVDQSYIGFNLKDGGGYMELEWFSLINGNLKNVSALERE